MSDEILRIVSSRLQYVLDEAVEIAQRNFPGIKKDTQSYRMSVLSIMKMLVALMQIDSELPQPEIPHFNPEELMQHKWKGKRKKSGEGYHPGSKSFGWDFKDQFSKDVLKTLEEGPITIDEYQFTLTDRIVQAKKVKK